MNFVAILSVVSLIGASPVVTVAHQLQSARAKKNAATATTDVLHCVYADATKTGKKTIVCGDPAPPTLAALLAPEKTDSPLVSVTTKSATDAAVTDATPENATQPRQSEARCLDGKKITHSPSVALVVRPQQHEQQQQQQQHYVRPAQAHYVQTQVHYEPLDVVCQRPKIDYQRPVEVYAGPADVHYGPIDVYQNNNEHAEHPLCSRSRFSSHGGRWPTTVVNGYPPLQMFRTVRPDGFVDDVHNVVTVTPYDGTKDSPVRRHRPSTAAIRPTPVMTPPLLRANAEDGVYVDYGVMVPADVMREFADLQVMRQNVRNPGGRFSDRPEYGTAGYAIPSIPHEFRGIPRSFEAQDVSAPVNGRLVSSSGVDGVYEEPSERSRKSVLDARNVKPSSTKSHLNVAKPTEKKKIHRFTRN